MPSRKLPQKPTQKSSLFSLLAQSTDNIQEFIESLEKEQNPHIAALASLTNHLINKNIVKLIHSFDTRTISFNYVKSHIHKSFDQAQISFSYGWAYTIYERPISTMCNLIFVASHVKDFSEKKFKKRKIVPEMTHQAKAYQAEYLLSLSKYQANNFSKYHKDIILNYPQGIKTTTNLVLNQ